MKKITILLFVWFMNNHNIQAQNIHINKDTIFQQAQQNNAIWFGKDSLDFVSIEIKKTLSIYNASDIEITVKSDDEAWSLKRGSISKIKSKKLTIHINNLTIIYKDDKIILFHPKGEKISYDSNKKRRYKKKNATNIYVNIN